GVAQGRVAALVGWGGQTGGGGFVREAARLSTAVRSAPFGPLGGRRFFRPRFHEGARRGSLAGHLDSRGLAAQRLRRLRSHPLSDWRPAARAQRGVMRLALRRGILILVVSVALSGCTTPGVSLPFSEPAAAVVDGHSISMKVYQARLQVSRHRDPFNGIPEAIPSPAPAQRLEDVTIGELVRGET